LKKAQTLFQEGFNDRFMYIVLFGKLQLTDNETNTQLGSLLNIGWTVGEEILFKNVKKPG
jgi:hypothetical protein